MNARYVDYNMVYIYIYIYGMYVIRTANKLYYIGILFPTKNTGILMAHVYPF